MRKIESNHQLHRTPNVSYDYEPSRGILYRTAIFLSQRAAAISETALKKNWDKVQRCKLVVLASRKERQKTCPHTTTGTASISCDVCTTCKSEGPVNL